MLTDCPSLIAVLVENRLLDAAAEGALPEMAAACAGPGDLVSELVRRRWLTHFQAELILAGRAAELVVDKYVLLERLGQGGMGAVYKARHRVLKAVRAVKTINPERLTGPNAVKRFFQEVEAVGKLFHPNIILPHDAGEAGGVYYLAMEYVPGADLGRLLERGGPLPAADACEYIRQGALALQHAFERGLVHRDIKPANLLVSSADGRVKLLDLGLARVRAVEEEGTGPQTALTQAGAMMGTPDYMAPEQAVDSHGVDTRADIYALGCTLYHVLAGRPPFPGGTVMDKLVKHRAEEAKPLESLRNDLPPGLSAAARKAMAKSPESRYQTPAEFASALAPFCAGARPDKPRPAGASGEHPVLAPVTRPSLTPPGVSGVHRAPTPPAKPTVTAPPGAMPVTPSPSPPARAANSVATRFDETDAPEKTLPAVPPLPRRPRRRPLAPVVLAMVAVGVLAAAGLRFAFRRPDVTATADRGSPPTAPAPPAATPPPAPPAVPVPVAVTPPAPRGPEKPPPDVTRPAEARGGAVPGGGLALVRAGAGDPQTAEGRAASPGRPEVRYRLDPDRVRAAAFSANGRRAAVVTDGGLEVYDVAGNEPKVSVAWRDLVPDPPPTPTAVALSADGRHAYVTTTALRAEGRTAKGRPTPFNVVVHLELGQAAAVLVGRPAESAGRPQFRCVAVSPDGGQVLAAGALPDFCRWNLAVDPPQPRKAKSPVGEGVEGLVFSPDGKKVLFCGGEPDLCLYPLTLGDDRPLPFKGHPKGARCAAFSANGQFAVSGGREGKVCVWDVTGPPPAEGTLLPAKDVSWHAGAVTAVAFGPAGDHFVTGGEDGTVCLGRVSRPDRVWQRTPDDPPAPVLGVGFSGDGAYALYATRQSLGRCPVRPPPLAEARGDGDGASPTAKPR